MQNPFLFVAGQFLLATIAKTWKIIKFQKSIWILKYWIVEGNVYLEHCANISRKNYEIMKIYILYLISVYNNCS